jgi:hypothetical protein
VSAPEEFVSKRYQFGVTMPQDWVGIDALADWNGSGLSGPGSPAFDSIVDPTGSRTLMVAAAPVSAGTKLADWQAAMVRATPKECEQSSPTKTTTAGGEPTLAWTVKCSDGFDANNLAVVHGQRGYIIYMPSATANDDAQDRSIFEGIRKSFRFTG